MASRLDSTAVTSRSVPSPDDALRAPASDSRPITDPGPESSAQEPAAEREEERPWEAGQEETPDWVAVDEADSSKPQSEDGSPSSADMSSWLSGRSEDELRARLGLQPKDWTLPVAVRLNGWIVTIVTGVLAA